jgi:16S rRNA (guanine966-N2)-methyltransferase
MRISGGDARGIQLHVPPGARPASERVRQAVFSSLAAAVPGASVLDLYCGSGAYGLEALSRGADRAVFVDRQPSAIKVARSNAEATGMRDECEFRRTDVRSYDAKRDGPFDLVFVDPPYEEDATRAVDAVAAAVRPGGRVVVETRWRASERPEPGGYVLDHDRRYGDTRVLIFRREGTA